MREEFVPELDGKGQVNTRQKSKKVFFEVADGAFGRVDSVEIRRHELVVTSPFLIYYTSVLLSGLVVKYLEVHLVATLLEAENDDILGLYTMEVLLGLEGLD